MLTQINNELASIVSPTEPKISSLESDYNSFTCIEFAIIGIKNIILFFRKLKRCNFIDRHFFHFSTSQISSLKAIMTCLYAIMESPVLLAAFLGSMCVNVS